MTIGIASFGTRSGAAVFNAVLAAELLGRGAIGGFAVFAILDADGKVHHRWTQDGGVGTLDIPASWHDAGIAACISSGPNRPEPLIQFLPGANGCALVTGHRLPHAPNTSDVPINDAVLARLNTGEAPQAAIDAEFAQSPEIDAGLIAITADGALGWANSARVQRRSDLGQARRSDADRRFALLHNSIFVADGPCQHLADALSGIAWQALTGTPAPHSFLKLGRPIAFRLAERDRIVVDGAGDIIGLETANPALLTAERVGTAGYLSAEIWQAERRIGIAVTELFARMAGGTAHPQDEPDSRNLMIARLSDVAA
ncbi:DUF6963 family protein [Neoaquamicrobium sediminum]|uniref:DUF6963 family protein n=1 Tax=Neoaquamicrobium sediminum TaxID=1849104 RepID=UPI003BAB0411